MTREERIEIVEHAAEAGAFDDLWRRGWQGTFDPETEDRTVLSILFKAASLVEESPSDDEESALWAWRALAWSAIRWGEQSSALYGETPSWMLRKVRRALARLAAGNFVIEVEQ